MPEKIRLLKKINKESFGGSENQFRLLMKHVPEEYFKGINLILNDTDFTHIEDIVDGLVRVNRAMMGEVDMVYHAPIFELGSGKNYSIDEVANMFGDDYPKKYLDKRPGEYDVTLADYSFAKDVLNWQPTKDHQWGQANL